MMPYLKREIRVPRTQMTHILEDLTHKMEGQPPKKQVSWVLGLYLYDFGYLSVEISKVYPSPKV